MFPPELASKILSSPNVDKVSGRLSRTSYILVSPESQSRTDSPSPKDMGPSVNDESSVKMEVSSSADESNVPDAEDNTAGVIEATSEVMNAEVVACDPSAPSNSEESCPTNSQDGFIIPSLPDSLLEEMSARMTYAFSTHGQMEFVKAYKTFLEEEKKKPAFDPERPYSVENQKPIVEPIVHLYYPQSGCHEVVDKAVETIAKAENAEVLTLDALALALAEPSVFGDLFHKTMSDIYNDLVRYQNEDKDKEKPSGNEDGSDDSSDEYISDQQQVRKRMWERRQRMKEIEKKNRKAQEEKDKKWEAEWMRKDDELQEVFDALVSLSEPQGIQDNVNVTKKRIIYLRDFGGIANAAGPFIVRLLRAIHARRTANFVDDECGDLVQPTLLILGYSECSDHRNHRSIGESAFVRSGDTLRESLPDISSEAPSGDSTTVTLSPMASRFFIGSLVIDIDQRNGTVYLDGNGGPWGGQWQSPVYHNPHAVHLRSRLSGFASNNPVFSLRSFDLFSASPAISIFLPGQEKKTFSELEKRLCDHRKINIANAWLRMSLAQRKRRAACDDIVTLLGNDRELQKYLMEVEGEEKKKREKFIYFRISRKDPMEKSKENNGPFKGQELLARLAKHTNSSVPVALEQGLTIALGLSIPEQSSGDFPDVPSIALAKAFRILVQNHKSRAAWWGEPHDSDDEGEDGKKNVDKDPVVQSVKNAKDLTEHEKELLASIIDLNELTTSFNDVCIAEKTIESLRTIISLPLKFPRAFESGILGRESMGGVLLYGSPGTGKTIVCRAVARECGARMLVIKPSDIMDKWVGESEKIVKAVFTLAYRLAPCLIFIDELDALFNARKEDDQKWNRDILAEFLQSMDGLKSAKKNKDAGVVLIGATNRPYDIDEAVIRRLPSRMIVDAPDQKQRKRILELHLRGETLDDDVRLDKIAGKAKNYSGSDLKNLCVSASMASVKDAIGTFTWGPMKSKDAPKAGQINL